MNLPLITVATVTYNSGKFLEDTLQSILSSSYGNFELIIADDNSQDNSWEIIEDFRRYDKRIKAFGQKRNIGEYANRNFCVEKAIGKYIVFVDGDDLIYPHGLGIMVEMMEKHPEAALGLSRPHDARFFYPKLLNPKETYYLHYFDKTVLNLSMARNIFKTEVLQAVGGFATGKVAGDDYIRLRIASEYPCLLMVDGLVWWRSTPGQASEKLGGTKGFIESLISKYTFLSLRECPLSTKEVEKAGRALDKKLYNYLLILLLKGKFKDIATLRHLISHRKK